MGVAAYPLRARALHGLFHFERCGIVESPNADLYDICKVSRGRSLRAAFSARFDVV
jgi:hypothetical protein